MFKFSGLADSHVVHGVAGRKNGLAEIQEQYPNLIMADQIHETQIYDVEGLRGLKLVEGFDGFATQKKGAALVIKAADCVPLLFYDSETRTIAAAHAGRRGTQQSMAKKMVEHLSQIYNVLPKNLFVGIGPSICANCYQIDKEKDIHYDLWAQNQKQLRAAGVENIELAGLCTACNANDEFYSYRREKTMLRNFAFICLK